MARTISVAVWLIAAVTAQAAGEDPVTKPVAPTEAFWAAPVDVEFKADLDKTVQKYVEMLPRQFDAKKPHDLMIALHGHGSDRWQYVNQARGECRGARDMAARHNMIFVSPDYRASTSWMGPAAEADMVQLIGLLRKKHRVRRVFLVGASMGGTSSLIFAALHSDLVDAVISSNGTANMIEYENFQDAIARSYGGDKKTVPDEYKKRSPELAWKRFTMPLALTVGGKDKDVPPDSVRRLYAQLQKAGKKDLLMIDRENTGHSTSYDDTVAAIDFVVKAAATSKPDKKKAKAGAKPQDKDAEPKNDHEPAAP
ncbi:MAG TPA: alpha/beta fold hydrolase [Phycisphaerae bacterium]|nr:alpha/beta fold hydrolase [Phycisphaerae bacterium]HOI57010.1 alpha/beta fold hydrolase [Phycisphaerae bacterium]